MTISITDTLALEENRLKRLDDERKSVLENIRKLREQLAVTEIESQLVTPASTLSPEAKIALFRSLFRGREDV